MKRCVKVLSAVILGLVVLGAIACGTSRFLSPPNAGRELARVWEVPHPAVVAHRGASWLAPESTAPAYELARDLGADYLEADLQRTRDRVVVAFHDETLERTTNVEEVFPDRSTDRIETFTYGELMELDHGSWFNQAYPERARDAYEGLGVVTLRELIEIAEAGPNNPGLYLETKSAQNHPGIEEDVLAVLEDLCWYPEGPELAGPDVTANAAVGAPTIDVAAGRSGIIFQSFHTGSLEQLIELAPEIPAVYLISAAMAEENGFRRHVKTATEMGALGVGPGGRLGLPWNTGHAHREGLLVHNYTINQPWQMRLLRSFGADGIFTDRPAVALEVFDRAEEIDVDAILDRLELK